MLQDSVVITGLGVVSPIGCSRQAVWANLREGVCGLRQKSLTEDFQIWFGAVAEDLPDTEQVLDFLPAELKAAAREDKGIAYGVVAGQRAIEESGLQLNSLAGERVGVVMSSSKGLLRSLLAANEMFRSQGAAALCRGKNGFGQLVRQFMGESVGRMLAAKLGVCGPVLNHPAACATGINSLASAANLLLDGVVDAVVAGSCESSANAVTLASFWNMGALSPEKTRPFHRLRSGFNPGEGAAAFVLERESDARRRGARIVARLAGWDFRSDGYHLTTVEPEGTVFEHTIRQTLQKAGWQPDHVDYICAHGTGTEKNDQTEAAVITRVFGKRSHGPYVSSLKPYTGHLLGASASVELALAMIALERDYMPPTLGLDEPDPALKLNYVPRHGCYRCLTRYMKLSLGFGGHIGAVAIEKTC